MKSDSFWKEVLEELLSEFLRFFFPHIHRDIDFSRGYQFLDKEFQKISKGAQTGRRIVDKLVKVYLKDGSEKWLLIHIEIQGKKEKEFAERMFTYNYRIFDRYRRETISLALLTDEDPNYRPNEFRIRRWDFECLFKFPLAKIIDYINDDFEKETKSNPFSLIVQAFLKTLHTQGNDQSRYQWKRAFILKVYELGLDHETLFRIYRFIEWIMEIPVEMDERLYNEIKQIEEHKEMSLITIAEKKGLEKGRQKGLLEGKMKAIPSLRKAIELLMHAKFGELNREWFQKIEAIDTLDALEKILLELEQANDFADFKQRIVRKKLLQ